MYSKDILEEVIYKIHKEFSFYGDPPRWSVPFDYFSYLSEDSFSVKHPKFKKKLKESGIIKEDISDLICVLGEWTEVAEGIFFTSKAMYLNSPKNTLKTFRVAYKDITQLKLYKKSRELDIFDKSKTKYTINSKVWDISAIKHFLDFSCSINNYAEIEKDKIYGIELSNGMTLGSFISGVTYGNVSNSSTIYGEDKFSTTRGHGFAAERANHLYDKISGRDASILGDDNAKNGADRIVDGVQIQSKYCATGSKCISECFDKGEFRYYNIDGSPMQIEVPSDKYESALTAMKERIKKGEVAGVSDPDEANRIIRRGHFTYEQVKNIAKAGTVESIIYDATNGVIISSSAFGITVLISFATSIWNGDNFEDALKQSVYNGLKVGGITFFAAVFSGQLSKAGLNSFLVNGSESIIKVLGPKGSAILVNSLRSGKNIYGAAAMKSAAKLLRGNIITTTVSVAIISSVDVVNIFRARISGTQLFKNVTNTVSTAGGGAAGWVGGATIGASIGTAVPIVGNVVGGVIGGLVGAFGGGALAGGASKYLLDEFIENDADKMVKVIEDVFAMNTYDYILNQKEAEAIVNILSTILTSKKLKDMFASDDSKIYAEELLRPLFENETQKRKHISPLSQELMQKGLRLVFEDLDTSKEILPV